MATIAGTIQFRYGVVTAGLGVAEPAVDTTTNDFYCGLGSVAGTYHVGPGLKETAAGTILHPGAIADGQFLVRSGSTIAGTGVVSGSSTFALTADITPAQITVNQNDYDPTDLATAAVLRLDADAARDITGLAGGADGRILILHNVGAFTITLKDESASSTAGNRFAMTADFPMVTDACCILQYDSTSSRWRVAGGGGGGLLAVNNLSDVASASTSRTNLGLGTMATQAASAVAITGGTISVTSVTAVTDVLAADVGILDAGADHYIILLTDEDNSAQRLCYLRVNNANRIIDLGGNLTLAGDFGTSGANSLTLTTTGATSVTLPTSGTLSTLAGAESLTNKTLGSTTLAAGATITGTAGAGALTLGSMTGATALPTGNLSWAGASTRTLSLAATAANATISTTTSGTIAVTSAGAVNHTSAAASTWTHSGGAWALNSTSQNITIATVTSGTLALTSAGALNLTSVAASTLAGSGGTLTIQSTSQALTLQTITSGTLTVTSAGILTMQGTTASLTTTSGAVTIDGQTGVNLQYDGVTALAVASAAVTVTGAFNATTSVTAGTSLLATDACVVTKNGSDTVQSGPYFEVRNAAATRSWVQQLDADNDLDFWYYNGTSWTVQFEVASNGTVTPSKVIIDSPLPTLHLKDTTTADTGFGVYCDAAAFHVVLMGDAGSIGYAAFSIDRATATVIFGSGGLPTGGGTPVVVLTQASGAVGTPASNTAGLIAKDAGGTAELYAWDEAGTETILSAHDTTGPAWLYDFDSPHPEHVVVSTNAYTGTREWINHTRMARLLERLLAGENVAALPAEQRTCRYVETGLPRRDWDADQVGKVARQDQAIVEQQERQRQHADAVAAWQALPEEERAATKKPSPFTTTELLEPLKPKPMPEWLKRRLDAAA